MRLFIASAPSAEVREALSDAVVRLQAGLTAMPLRWVPPENNHLTLRFLGDTTSADVDPITERLRGVCGRFQPFAVPVGGLGCFPDLKKPKVLWVGLGETPVLTELHAALQEAMTGFGTEAAREREAGRAQLRFFPHVTIARVKDVSPALRGRLGQEIQRQMLRPLWLGSSPAWPIDRVTLMESQLTPAGPNYRELISIPFAVP